MRVWEKVAKQFGNPSGIPGAIVGRIMANRGSNNERIAWAISLLDLRATDHVLEVGFGPGVAIRTMSEIVVDGAIVGIDHSNIMVRQASRRNREAIEEGRVKLVTGSVSQLPPIDPRVDKVLTINSFQFWKTPHEDLVKVKSVMAPGGVIAVVHQPRNPGATNADTERSGKRIAECLEKAGFREIAVEQKLMMPVSTVCVLGRN